MPKWIVIGGGIVGASCAYFLAADGHEVTLVERAGLAGGTSSACQNNMGAPIGGGEATRYFQTAVGVYDELRAKGFDLDYVRHGHLYVARTESVAEALLHSAEEAQRAGLRVEIITPEEYHRVEPRLAPGIKAAALLPDGAQVSPMAVVFELARAAVDLGARILTRTEVTGITAAGDRIRGVETSGGPIECDGVVIAAGPWSAQVATLAGLAIPVAPRRGTILVTEPAPGWLSHGVIDYGFDSALLEAAAPGEHEAVLGTVVQPLPSGNLLIGGSVEIAGFDRKVDRRIAGEIARLAAECLPDIRSLKIIRTYAGLRPYTPDGLPLVGPVPELDGLMLATGHGGAGIDAGPLAGRLTADLVAARAPIVDPSILRPDRFGTLVPGGASDAGTRPGSVEVRP